MGIQTCHPFQHSPYSEESSEERNLMLGKFYLPPLLHALHCQFWGLCLFLLSTSDGKALAEKTSPYTTVLDHSMSIGIVHPEIIRFFFGVGNSSLLTSELPRGGKYVPPFYRDAGGYYVYRLLHDCITGGNFRLSLPWDTNGKFAQIDDLWEDRGSNGGRNALRNACESVESAWRSVLDLFPEAENSPTGFWFGVIPYKKLSIIEQSVRLHADFRSSMVVLSRRGFIIPFQRYRVAIPPFYKGFKTLRATLDTFKDGRKRRSGFPKQSLFEKLQGSPLDLMTQRGMRKSGLYLHGWTISIWHPAISGALITILSLVLFIYSLMRLSFIWFWIIPNLVNIAIWIFLAGVVHGYFASWWLSVSQVSDDHLIWPYYMFPSIYNRSVVTIND